MTDQTIGRAHELDAARIRHIAPADLVDALRLGLSDALSRRTDTVFLVIVYPVIGIVAAAIAAGGNVLELVFPLVTGFALVGSLAAIGTYEISRQLEQGKSPHPVVAFREAFADAGGRLLVMGIALLALFVAWIIAADALWYAIIGADPPRTVGTLLETAFGTGHGWTLIIVGYAVGAVFAVIAMAISVFALPMLLDGERSVAVAVITSVRACFQNPGTMLLWGLIVAVVLAVASVPALVGLIVALPVLGHATWRLYRRTIDLEH